ncbi:MAG: hypothetical protein Q8N05_03660 [Bacteroidota bacterium]|nr:hypothetical protein [Bacteroidota bacterium]
MEIEEKLNRILVTPKSDENIHPSKPGSFKEAIADTSEKAYQRAILFGRSTILNDKPNQQVHWYDIELPVVLNKNSRRPCIDLIGHDSRRFVLCELKFGNNKSDSPIAAVRELLEYYRLIIINSKYLDQYKIHHKNSICNEHTWNWASILENIPLILIAANEGYWKHWRKTTTIDYEDQLKQIKLWSNELGLDIALYETKDYDFKSQRNNKPSYWPKLEILMNHGFV